MELSFSDKEITAWGGMSLMKRMLDHLEFSEALKSAKMPEPGSNRGYRPFQLITQFMLSIWCGANRFEHTEITRHDPVLQKIFGFKTMANFQAVIRLFERFTAQDNEQVMDYLYRWFYGKLSLNGATLDLDSTVMTRYGHQEGAKRGYNAKKPGRVSHHPLLAFVDETTTIANCWLRPGNASSASNVCGFLENTLSRLGEVRVALVRADSGFCDNAFLSHLEEKSLSYVIALRHHGSLQRALIDECAPHSGWCPLKDEAGNTVPGIELKRFLWQATAWDKPRWVVGIRQHIGKREVARGRTLSLFADDPLLSQYRFSSLVSNLDLPAITLWRMYRGRANCENRIKELQADFAADSFCLQNFWATEVALNTVMIAYNLMSLFRQAVLKSLITVKGEKKSVQHTLQTLRYKLFAKPAFIVSSGRKTVLKMAVSIQQRAWIKGLWENTNAFNLPLHFQPENTS